MKSKLRILAENSIYALLLTALTFMLRLFELPDSRVIMPAFWSQMLRNYVIVYVSITVTRFIAPCVKRLPLKWKWEAVERYEKIILFLGYLLVLLVMYLIFKLAVAETLRERGLL